MNINDYKVLDELKFNDDTIYVIKREPAFYYSEFNADSDTKIGIVFSKDKEVLGVSWVNDFKFENHS